MDKSDLNFYVYISEGKLSMLLGQAGVRSKIGGEIKLSLAMAEVSGRWDRGASDEQLINRAKKAEELMEPARLGSVDEPREYIRGELAMRYGLVTKDGETAVFFVGRTLRTALLLGGSSSHLLSKGKPLVDTGSYSAVDRLVAFMDRSRNGRWDEGEYYMEHLVTIEKEVGGPRRKYAFLAKVLATAKGGKRSFDGVLATPIYVTLAE